MKSWIDVYHHQGVVVYIMETERICEQEIYREMQLGPYLVSKERFAQNMKKTKGPYGAPFEEKKHSVAGQ